MTDSPALPVTHTTADRWRDSLVRLFIEMPNENEVPAAFLANIDPVAATVVLVESGQPIVFLTWPENDPAAVVLTRRRIGQIAETARPGLMHVVLVGGGDEAWEVCKEQQPFWQLDRRVALHAVSEGNGVRHSADRLKLLEEAVRELERADGPPQPLTWPEIETARDRFSRLVQSEERVSNRLTKAPSPATIALIVTVAVIFALEMLWGGNGATFYRMGALERQSVAAGQFWRLLSCVLLHGSLIHVAVNGWSIWALGRFVEKLIGTSRYLVLFGLSGIVGSIASVLTLKPMATSVGASGALFGIMGGLVALTLRPGKVLPPASAARIKRNLWPVLLMNLVISLQPNIDKFAHLGGFVAGMALVWSGLLTSGLGRGDVIGSSPMTRRSTSWATVAAGILVVAYVAAFGIALKTGQPWLPIE